MKELFEDFRDGSVTQKLNILANLSTILGVSVATFVAGPFLSRFAEIDFIVTDFIIAIIFYFVYLLLSLSLLYSMFTGIHKMYVEKNYGEVLSNSVLALFLIWFVVFAFPYAKYYTGNLFQNSYLLPLPAQDAVKELNDFSIYVGEDFVTIKGSLVFDDGVDPENYVVVAYHKASSGIYHAVMLADREHAFELGRNGKFTMPTNAGYRDFSDVFLIVYRNSDWSIFDAIGISGPGFPNGLTQIPNKDVDELGAFIYRPQA
ncbi:hypothetical protein [Marinobacter adhaerens]|jgi:hypothetical protein|uniref:hypothetical protein n=1 Tax=Marinobacter adhaerens TaxID=1033846 RepID=UPI003BA90583